MAGDDTGGEILKRLDELARGVHTVQSQQSTVLANQEKQGRAYQVLDARVTVLGEDVAHLKRLVHGSDPPPDAGAAPLVEAVGVATRKASSASLETASLEGRMLAGFASLEQRLAAQDRALGVGRSGLRFLFSPPMLRALPAVIAAIAALAAALRGAPAPATAPQVAPVPASAQR